MVKLSRNKSTFIQAQLAGEAHQLGCPKDHVGVYNNINYATMLKYTLYWSRAFNKAIWCSIGPVDLLIGPHNYCWLAQIELPICFKALYYNVLLAHVIWCKLTYAMSQIGPPVIFLSKTLYWRYMNWRRTRYGMQMKCRNN